MNLAAMTHSLDYRLCSWATHSAVMQFEGMDADRNYESCPCRGERGGERAAPLTLKISREVERPPAAQFQTDPEQKQCNKWNCFFLTVKDNGIH